MDQIHHRLHAAATADDRNDVSEMLAGEAFDCLLECLLAVLDVDQVKLLAPHEGPAFLAILAASVDFSRSMRAWQASRQLEPCGNFRRC
jgi:hypothetical protein